MKQILIFSHIYQENDKSFLIKNNNKPCAQAISNYEQNIIDSLSNIPNTKISLFNRPFLNKMEVKNDTEDLFLSKLCKHKYQNSYFYYHYCRNNKELIKQIQNSTFVIFSTYHDWRLFKFVKKINKKIKTILFLPDMPQFIVAKVSFKHKMLRKYTTLKFNRNIKHIDGLVAITKHMESFYRGKVNNTITIEGVAQNLGELLNSSNKENTKSIIYAGTLSEKYGIKEMINAFKNSKFYNDYKLLIYGNGELSKYVNEESKNFTNIVFEGFIPKEQLLLEIYKANFVIIPESTSNNYAKYSFHSKILECMSIGTPIIGTIYEGVPDEYKTYIYEIPNDTTLEENLHKAFDMYLSMDYIETQEFGKKAKNFIQSRAGVLAISRKLDSFFKKILTK